MVTNFSTKGGVVTRGETFSKMLHHLNEAQDCAYVIAHLHQTEDNAKDSALAMGWRVIGENLKMVTQFITKLAQGKLH